MPEICRMCSENSVLLVPMVKHTNSKDELEEIGSQFESCFGIEVLATPDYTSICSLCHKKLCCFYEVKQKVLKTHEELLQHYNIVIVTEENAKSEILENLEIEYFQDDETCLTLQKLVEETNSLSASSDRSIDEPVESMPDSLDETLPEQTVTSRQIPSPIIKIEGLRENMILLEKDEKQKENEQDYDCDDEFDEIQDDELEEIERISLGDIDDILNVEDFNPDEIFEDGTTVLKCHVCRRNFSNKQKFKIHMVKCKQLSLKSKLCPLKYSRNRIHCDQCKKTFALEETLKAHMNTHHRGLPAYTCEICGKDFNHRICYIYHMRNHNNERRFICEICSKAFLAKGDLSRHIKCHNEERPYVCHICGKGYKLFTNLKEHSEIHSEEYLHECKICKIKLQTRTLLRRHISIFHKISDPRLYCTLCKKQFNRRYRFINHLKSQHPDESEEMMSKVEQRVMKRFQMKK